MTPTFVSLRHFCSLQTRIDSNGRLHADYKLNAINRLNQLLQSLVHVDFGRDVVRAVTQNQLFAFQRDFGVVRECGARVASVVWQVVCE